jgi:hypothetical protein
MGSFAAGIFNRIKEADILTIIMNVSRINIDHPDF